jgi:hypothetical protein
MFKLPNSRIGLTLTGVILAALAACGTQSSTNSFTALEFLPKPLQPAYIGEPYQHEVQITNGTRPYVLKLLKGPLPPGITLNDRALTGTPTGTAAQAKSYSFTLEVSDANLSNKVQDFTLEVRVAPLALIEWKVPETSFKDETKIPFILKGAKKIRSFKLAIPLPANAKFVRLETGQGKPIMISRLEQAKLEAVAETPKPATETVPGPTSQTPASQTPASQTPAAEAPTTGIPAVTDPKTAPAATDPKTAPAVTDPKPIEAPAVTDPKPVEPKTDPKTGPKATVTESKPGQILRIDGALTEPINSNRDATIFYLVVSSETGVKLEGKVGYELRNAQKTISSAELVGPAATKTVDPKPADPNPVDPKPADPVAPGTPANPEPQPGEGAPK